MENDQREHFARLLEDVRGDPKTSAALMAMLEAIVGEVRALRGQCDRCQDCGNTQGAALDEPAPVADPAPVDEPAPVADPAPAQEGGQ